MDQILLAVPALLPLAGGMGLLLASRSGHRKASYTKLKWYVMLITVDRKSVV